MGDKFYRTDKAMETDFDWLLCMGQRSNGKSYAWKEKVVEDYFKNKNKFIYLRRWGKDIKENSVTSYFEDCPVKKISKGLYDGVVAFHGHLFLYTLDDNEDIIKGAEIGRYCALNESARYKSQVFTDYKWILYEEMIPDDNIYCDDECSRIQHFASSVFRRNKGKVVMIGNTLSRVCPYVTEFGLTNFLHQKQGTLEQYNYTTGDTTVKVVVEYCESIKYQNTIFFGNTSKQILSGEWEVTEVPKLEHKYNEYQHIYKILIEYQNFRFMLELLLFEGNKIVFIYPFTGDKEPRRILTDRYKEDIFVSSRLNMNIIPETIIRECFMNNKVAFSDNLTGCDFRGVNEHFQIAPLLKN